MMKGHAYSNADSTQGLQMALKCYGKAHEEDPRLSEPLAAIAVASLNLAARTDSAESLAHLEKARSSMTQALQRDPKSVDARLAEAMIEWQTLHHYDEAERILESLHREKRYNWQVQHQRGLLLATLGRRSEATDALRTASKLNPMSMLIKTDRFRVEWFFGNGPTAIREVRRYRDSVAADNPARMLAVGLLIDLYEEQRDFAKAAEQLGLKVTPGSAEEYFREREKTLREYPYGPFGGLLNRAILDLRTSAAADEGMLGVLDESGATMFPLLLSQHPAFSLLRATDSAADYLPASAGRPVVVG